MIPYVHRPLVRQFDRVAARSVFLILLAVYTATFTGMPEVPDAEVEFQTTSALARTGRLALGGTPEARAIIEHGFSVLPGVNGESYSRYGVGQGVLTVPLYLVGRAFSGLLAEVEDANALTTEMGVHRSEYFPHVFAGWRNALLTALIGWLVVLTSRRIGVSRSTAWISGLAYGLTSFAWAQARSTLSDVQATFFLFLAFALLMRIREEFDRLRSPRFLLLLGFGAAMGMAFLTRVAMAPSIVMLWIGAMFVLRMGRRKVELLPFLPGGGRNRTVPEMLALASMPALFALAVFFTLNRLRYGDPLESGYNSVLSSGTLFSYSPLLGWAGLLVSPGRGLLWLAPLLCLVPLGLSRAWSRGERLWPAMLASLTVLQLGPLGFAQGWHGGTTFGPRYLLPLLPFLWLGVGSALEVVRDRPWLRVLAGALFVLGLLTQLPSALVDHRTHQDLAVQAARYRWPDVEGATPRERDEARFLLIQWDWSFAAPWAHWRILRHRVAGLGESFRLDEIFGVGGDRTAEPGEERWKGYRHLAWVDYSQRLGGPRWPGPVICLLMLFFGLVYALRALDPTAP